MNLTIETERLSLVPISRKYAYDIFREFTKDITAYMYPKPAENIEETYAFIDGAIQKDNQDEQLQTVILNKSTREFLGLAGLHEIKTKTPELGIWLKKSAHGFHFGREAIIGLVDWAKTNLDFDYLKYPVDRRNISSRRIPESLGGIPGGEKKQTNLSGFELDEIEYRIPKVVKSEG